jgi:hypothetical protein
MANLLDCRAQEALCRIHALTDEQHRDLWLSMAERWSYLAQAEMTAFGRGGANVFVKADAGVASRSGKAQDEVR